MSDNPFHHRGPITPRDFVPWQVMHWHQDLIASVFADLDRDPPEYVAVLAPALGGKTTFAHQLIDRANVQRPDLLIVYIDLAGLHTTSGFGQLLAILQDTLNINPDEAAISSVEAEITRRVWNTWYNRLAEILEDRTRFDLSVQQQVMQQVEPTKPSACDDLETTLAGMLKALEDSQGFLSFTRVVFVFDGFEGLAVNTTQAFCDRLRSIHALRLRGPLKSFSAVFLAETLRPSECFVSPLANVVETYHLPGFSREELDRFLRECGENLDGVAFEAEAVDYLWGRTRGTPVLIQKICHETVRSLSAGMRVGLTEVLEGIASCLEEGGAVFNRLLDSPSFSEDTQTRLGAILRKVPVLHHAFDPSIAQLVEAGIITKNSQQRCVISSPILRALLLKRFRPLHQPLPRLTETELVLVDIPHFLSLIYDQLLFDKVCDVLDQQREGSKPAMPPEDAVVALLQDQQLDIDETAIGFFMRRYLKEIPRDAASRESVVKLMAKIYAMWYQEPR